MTDNHVHVGWYSDGYHYPKDVWQSECEAGIDEIAVSSTSTCAELYKIVVQEMKELVKLGGSNIHPILWITPKMMKTWGIHYMLHSKIRWQAIKMHWEAHREWFYNTKLTKNALEIARRLRVPVLIHTGEHKECHAEVFIHLCSCNPDLTFVLAHGRPITETISVLNTCKNVMVDTAFMSAVEVKQLMNSGFCQRILFGTDAPINLLYYKDLSITQYIKKQIEELQKMLTSDQFETLMENRLYE